MVINIEWHNNCMDLPVVVLGRLGLRLGQSPEIIIFSDFETRMDIALHLYWSL